MDTPDPLVRRRSLLVGSATGALVLASPEATQAAGSRYFQHGVASGDPHPRSVILWTRVTPSPAATPGSQQGPRVLVHWQVARDRRFLHVVSGGTFATGPDRDHTVKLEVHALRPATRYFYRFWFRGEPSRVGTTSTAPAYDADPGNLRFGVVSCANLQAGYFSAYRHLARRDDLDAVLHLGDYIYEYEPGGYGYGFTNEDIRSHVPSKEVHDLRDYRRRHAQYKQDLDLQALHAKVPFIATWDDHEVANDQWVDGAENHDPETEGRYRDRKRRADRAYDEWMPVRMGDSTTLNDGSTLYRRMRFGTLAELSMLDLRSYRSQQSAQPAPPVPSVDGTVSDPERTITGNDQMAWLKDSLRRDVAQWKLVGNPVMITPVVFPPLPHDLTGAVNDVAGLLPEDGAPYNVDQWDGYTADRHELFAHLAEHGITDTVFLTGDIHSGWACDLPLDAGSDPTRSVATEFVCTSVTSNNLKDITGSPPRTTSLAVEAAIQAANRHVRYLNFDDNGYSVLDVTPRRTQMDYYVIGDRRDPNTPATWTASWATDANSQRVHPVAGPVDGPVGGQLLGRVGGLVDGVR